MYLAQDVENGCVALKTTDIQKMKNSEECISNEIDILSSIETRQNIVNLLGFNRDEQLVVMEYCFNGNLKDYISRYREYFMDELDPETKELYDEPLLHQSESEEEKTQLSEIESESLIKTRRLLDWSYQISKGLKYLSDIGIIHRDIALRNMLLANNNLVKLGDWLV